MPGTGEKRTRPGPAVRAPSYVVVPAQVVYARAPDALVVTMVRILGLCWTQDYHHTPALTYEELARLLDRPRSTLHRHLDLLEQELGWLRREREGRRWVLCPLPPFADPALPGGEPRGDGQEPGHGTAVAVECPGPGCSETHGTAVAVEDRDRGYDPGHGTAVAVPHPGNDGRAAGEDGEPSWEEVLAGRQDLIQALAEVGIENPARERIALDPRVKVDWIAAWQLWAEHPDRASLSNLPGYVVQCLRHRERPPDRYLRLVRLSPAEKAQLERSRWDGGPDLDPDLRAIRPLYLQHLKRG